MFASNTLWIFIQTSLALILISLGYIILSFIIIPLWKMQKYKKYGLLFYFFPFLGPFKRLHNLEKSKKDSFFFYRELGAQNQNALGEVINFGNMVGINLLDPKLIKEFHSKQSNYRKVELSKAVDAMAGSGLVFSEGEVWKKHRKTISSIFHFDFLKQNIPLMINTTKEFYSEIINASLNSVHIMDEIQKITGEIVGRIFFGENLNKYTHFGKPLTLYLQELGTRMGQIHQKPLVFFLRSSGLPLELMPSFRHLLKEIKVFRSLCQKIIQYRKALNSNGNNLLGLLLETQSL